MGHNTGTTTEISTPSHGADSLLDSEYLVSPNGGIELGYSVHVLPAKVGRCRIAASRCQRLAVVGTLDLDCAPVQNQYLMRLGHALRSRRGLAKTKTSNASPKSQCVVKSV